MCVVYETCKSCCADSDAKHGNTTADGPAAELCMLKMRACLQWADMLLKYLATPGDGGVQANSMGTATAGQAPPPSSRLHEAVLLHVLTSFAPGHHSSMCLKPGGSSSAEADRLGTSGAVQDP